MTLRIIVFTLFFVNFYNVSAQKKTEVDSLKNALIDADISEKSSIYIKLAKFYGGNDSKSQLLYAVEGYKCAKTTENNEYQGLALLEIMKYHIQKSNYDSAYSYVNKALPLFTSNNNKALAYSNLSSLERDIGNYEQSISLLIKSDSLYSIENDLRGMIMSNGNLGIILGKKGDYKASIRHFKKAEILAEGNDKILSQIYNNLSVSYSKIADLKNAKVYGRKAIVLKEKVNNKYGMAHAYNNYANLLSKENKNAQGISYLEKAISILEGLDAKKDLMNCYTSLASIYRKEKNFGLARNNILKAEKIGQNVNNHTSKLETLRELQNLYKETKQWDKAYFYLDAFNSLKDSIINKEKIKITKDLETKYKTNQIRKEKELAETNVLLAQTKATSNKNFGIAMSFFGIITLLGGLFAYQRLKNKKKQEILTLKLEESISRLHLEQQTRISELKVLQSQMNPHFIFNALNSIQDLILIKDVRGSNKYLGKFSTLLRKAMSYSNKGFVTICEEIEILHLYIELEKLRFGKQLEITVDNKLDEIFSETFLIPAMFIQPYIENALKHGMLHKEGEKLLSITFKEENDFVVCVISDNGIGRKKAAEIKNRRNNNHLGYATMANEKRIDILNEGKVVKMKLEIIDKIENEIAKGTTVKLYFPAHEFRNTLYASTLL